MAKTTTALVLTPAKEFNDPDAWSNGVPEAGDTWSVPVGASVTDVNESGYTAYGTGTIAGYCQVTWTDADSILTVQNGGSLYLYANNNGSIVIQNGSLEVYYGYNHGSVVFESNGTMTNGFGRNYGYIVISGVEQGICDENAGLIVIKNGGEGSMLADNITNGVIIVEGGGIFNLGYNFGGTVKAEDGSVINVVYSGSPCFVEGDAVATIGNNQRNCFVESGGTATITGNTIDYPYGVFKYTGANVTITEGEPAVDLGIVKRTVAYAGAIPTVAFGAGAAGAVAADRAYRCPVAADVKVGAYTSTATANSVEGGLDVTADNPTESVTISTGTFLRPVLVN